MESPIRTNEAIRKVRARLESDVEGVRENELLLQEPAIQSKLLSVN